MCCCHLCHCESRVHSDSGPQSAPGAVWLVFGKEKNHKRPSIKWMFKVFWEVKWCRGKCEGVKAALHPAPAPASQPGRSEPFAMLQNCNSKAAHTTPHHYSFQVESKEQATDSPYMSALCSCLRRHNAMPPTLNISSFGGRNLLFISLPISLFPNPA